MESSKGLDVDKLLWKGLMKVCDLLEFEGPLLSHFKDKDGNNILFYWVDYDSLHNRWLTFQVSDEQIAKFKSEQITLRSLIEGAKNGIYFTVDIDAKIEWQRMEKFFSLSELNPDYLPGPEETISTP